MANENNDGFFDLGAKRAKESANNLDVLHIQLEGILSHYEKDNAEENKFKKDKKANLEETLKETEASIGILKHEITLKEKEILDIEETIEELQASFYEDLNSNVNKPEPSENGNPQEADATHLENIEDKEAEKKKKKSKITTRENLRFLHKIVENPEESKLVYWLIVLLMIVLSVTLWSFYSSAFFSVYLRYVAGEVSSNDGGYGVIKIAEITIFKLSAFTDIWQKSWGEILFGSIFLIGLPFIFIAVIFVNFIFKRKRKFYWVYAIYFAVLVMDVLLAFQIIREIQIARESAQSIIKVVQAPLISDILLVLPDVRFGLLVMTGFASYFMLGIIFDFFILIHDRVAERKNRIAEKKKEIDEKVIRKKNDIEKARQKVYELERQITEKNGIREILKNQIEHISEYINVDPKVVKNALIRCIEGWVCHLNEDQEHAPGLIKYKNDLSQKFKEKMEEFITKIDTNYNHRGGGR